MRRAQKAAERLWFALNRVRKSSPDAKFPPTTELVLMAACGWKDIRAVKHLLIDNGLLVVNEDYSVWYLRGTRFPWDVQR